MFTNQAISITAPRLWNDLPLELRNYSLPPPPPLQITNNHLHPAPVSVTPGPSTQNLKMSSLQKLLTWLTRSSILPLSPTTTSTLTATLSPLTLWKSDLCLLWTTLWTNHWFKNKLVPLRLALWWRSRNFEIAITITNDNFRLLVQQYIGFYM